MKERESRVSLEDRAGKLIRTSWVRVSENEVRGNEQEIETNR